MRLSPHSDSWTFIPGLRTSRLFSLPAKNSVDDTTSRGVSTPLKGPGERPGGGRGKVASSILVFAGIESLMAPVAEAASAIEDAYAEEMTEEVLNSVSEAAQVLDAGGSAISKEVLEMSACTHTCTHAYTHIKVGGSATFKAVAMAPAALVSTLICMDGWIYLSCMRVCT